MGEGTSRVRATLLVLYTPRLEECRRFYGELGLRFATEQHGAGPVHYAAPLADGTVLELYPAHAGRETGALRLGLAVPSADTALPLAPGHHILADPDGRTVAVQAV